MLAAGAAETAVAVAGRGNDASSTTLPHGATFDKAARALGPPGAGVGSDGSADEVNSRGGAVGRILRVDAHSLLRFSQCGFEHPRRAAVFERQVVAPFFAGQYSFCGVERNPNVETMLAEARAAHMAEEPLLKTRRNCTGQPANEFNKPKVDLGPKAFALRKGCDAMSLDSGLLDGVEAALRTALELVRLGPRKASA